MANCRRNAQLYLANPVGDEILRKIQQLMQSTAADQQTSLLASSSPLLVNSARHSPIVLIGNEGTGKTTILAQVFSQSQNWFELGAHFLSFIFWFFDLLIPQMHPNTPQERRFGPKLWVRKIWRTHSTFKQPEI